MTLQRNTILIGDATDHLRQLPPDSVDCIVTSPPYFALRDYEAGGQIGLEPHIKDWVERLVTVTDELGRVLKPEGSLWLNLGDSYSRHERYGEAKKGFLLGPERLLLAMASRGWLVRNKVVWAKPNPMPNSVQDRLTTSWEPFYLLVRSARYWFDLDPIRVPHRTQRRRPRSRRGPEPHRPEAPPIPTWAGPLAGNQSGLPALKASGLPGHPLGKNPGDVWLIPKNSRRGSTHHAAFPTELVERPILASCPSRTCTACGRGWRPGPGRAIRPDCGCGADHRPGLVLDPFMGSGTTALASESLGRDWLGIELNPAFAAEALSRLQQRRDDVTRR
jgi:site-specific DNA-methyltransferase (adenine-specific)